MHGTKEKRIGKDIDVEELDENLICICDSHHVFTFNAKSQYQYRKVAGHEVNVLREPFPLPYTSDTDSEDPIFPLCNNCSLLLRIFLTYRNSHPKRSIASPLLDLHDLYDGLREQYLLDPEEQKKAQRLAWKHRSYSEGIALTDVDLNANPHLWVRQSWPSGSEPVLINLSG